MRRVDAFDGLSSAPRSGSIRAAIRTEAMLDGDQLVAYLRSAGLPHTRLNATRPPT